MTTHSNTTDEAAQLAAGATRILPADGLVDALERAPLRVKFGIDPSGPELTLGHAVVLRKLREFQDHGHTAVLVIGDVTGTVGDPTGRTSGRSVLTRAQTTSNAETYLQQAGLILRADRLEVRHNSEWLGSMTLPELLGHAQHVTVAQLLERGDFAARHAAHRPIALAELCYPLMQGIDSVATRCDVEIGGNDQFFNLLMGRELQRAAGLPAQVVLTMPLLEGLDGVVKMSKSHGNYVSLAEPAPTQFGKLMSIPDTLMGRYGQLCAGMDAEAAARLDAIAALGGPPAAEAKRRLAATIVALYHGEKAARDARTDFDRRFRDHAVPDRAPTIDLGADAEVYLPRLLVDAGFARSGSEARRLIDSGATRLDGVAVPGGGYHHRREELAGRTIAVGRRHVARLGD